MSLSGPQADAGAFYRAVIDAVPSAVFVVDDDVRIVESNAAGRALLGDEPELVYRHRAGEALHCIHSTETPGGCGHAPACRECIVRNSVREASLSRRTNRARHPMELRHGGTTIRIQLLVTATPLVYQGEGLVLLLLEDVTELFRLRDIVPICASCKRVRNDAEYWQSVESYFATQIDARFSHGICPECRKKLYPEL